jgi:hypothetical protein
MNGGVINEHTALGHHLLDMAQAQRIRHVPAYAGEHHLQRVIRLITLRSASIIAFVVSTLSPNLTSIGLSRQNLQKTLDPIPQEPTSSLAHRMFMHTQLRRDHFARHTIRAAQNDPAAL